MSYRWRPRLAYSGGVLTFALSQRPFDEGVQAFGAGYEESAALVPSAWVTTWAHVLTVRVRFWESERAAVLSYLRTVMESAEPHTIRLDAGNVATEFAVYLVAPKLGGEVVAPTRSGGDTVGLYEMEWQYRRTNGAAFDLNYYGV